MQRRGFLGAILAAGMAPAAIGSGILMPVKKIALFDPADPFGQRGFIDFNGPWEKQRDFADITCTIEEYVQRSQAVFCGGLLWQDAEGTIPVTEVGQPVGRADNGFIVNGRMLPLVQYHPRNRPTWDGGDVLRLEPGQSIRTRGHMIAVEGTVPAKLSGGVLGLLSA